MFVDVAALFDLAIAGSSGRVVSENIERCFTGVETARTGFNRAVHFVFLADLILKITAFQILVESFVCFHLNHPFFFLQS